MNERMKTFIYCAITAIVTTIVISAGRPQAVQAEAIQVPKTMTVHHVIKFGMGTRAGSGAGFIMNDTDARTLIIEKK